MRKSSFSPNPMVNRGKYSSYTKKERRFCTTLTYEHVQHTVTVIATVNPVFHHNYHNYDDEVKLYYTCKLNLFMISRENLYA